MKDFLDNFPWFTVTSSLIIGGFMVLTLWPAKAQQAAPPRPRFEQLLREFADNDAKKTDIRTFEVWHDKESGIEFICAVPHTTLESADKVSCFPTHRSWK